MFVSLFCNGQKVINIKVEYLEKYSSHPLLLYNEPFGSFSKSMELVRHPWISSPIDFFCPFPPSSGLPCCPPLGTDLSPISQSCVRMSAFGEWAFSGRTLHNQKCWSAKAVTFFSWSIFRNVSQEVGEMGNGTESTRHHKPGNKMSKHSFSKLNEDINLH